MIRQPRSSRYGSSCSSIYLAALSDAHFQDMADERRQLLAVLHVLHQHAQIVVDDVVVLPLQRFDEHIAQLGNRDHVFAPDFQQHVHEVQTKQALIAVVLRQHRAHHFDQRHQFHGFPVLFELE